MKNLVHESSRVATPLGGLKGESIPTSECERIPDDSECMRTDAEHVLDGVNEEETACGGYTLW